MRAQTLRRNLITCAALFAFAVLLSASAAHRAPQATAPSSSNEIVLNVDPAQSTVRYTVGSSLHTVHGTFALKRGNLRVDPTTGKAAGEIVVDAVSGESGNNSRDKKMHKEVLESARYTEVIFRPDRVEGTVQPEGTSTAQLHGVCVLHGSDHELTVPVQAELKSDQWKGTAHFSIPYNDWGLKNPSNFLLKVDHAVTIEVQMSGSLQRQAAAAKP
jgi:polyisoprenoid-binding protein YceI